MPLLDVDHPVFQDLFNLNTACRYVIGKPMRKVSSYRGWAYERGVCSKKWFARRNSVLLDRKSNIVDCVEVKNWAANSSKLDQIGFDDMDQLIAAVDKVEDARKDK